MTASIGKCTSTPSGPGFKDRIYAHALLRTPVIRIRLNRIRVMVWRKRKTELTLTSSDDTTTARTKRKAHVVSYKNKMRGPAEQRVLDATTSAGKSETSVSSTRLDADPWANWLEVKRRTNLLIMLTVTITSTTPDCTSSGNGHTLRRHRSGEPQCIVGVTKPATISRVLKAKEIHKIKCPNRTIRGLGRG